MAETAQQYIDRMLNFAGGDDPVSLQAQTPAQLQHLILGLSETTLRTPPAPGKWSIIEILAHLADTEIAIGFRLRQILATPGIALQPFDQDAWAATGNYPRRDPRQALEQFRVLREANLALYQSLSEEQRDRAGMHAERGPESIRHIMKLIAGHDRNHLQQIEKIMAESSAVAG